MRVQRWDHGGMAKMWAEGVPVEDEAMAQLGNVARLPFIFKHLAVMPDVHLGMGATIGSVIPTVGAVIPAAVGVDIGCGMRAVRTDLTAGDLPGDLAPVRAAIEAAIPHGRSHHGDPSKDVGGWLEKPPAAVDALWDVLLLKFGAIEAKHPAIAKSNNRNHLGTLGTGNHFVEVCLDEQDRVWLFLHSGSRGVGGKIGSYFIKAAKKACKRWFVTLPDPNLAFLPEGTDLFRDYMEAVQWAQDFAGVSRAIMAGRALQALCDVLGHSVLWQREIDCHHNFVAREHHFGRNVWVTRKGAVRARKGDMVLIPGSMGARSYVCRGLGEPQSFTSCSHGAGRKMSRGAARRTFTVEDHRKATEGIECPKDASVLDETPGAYKDIDAVMAAQSDLVEPIHTLRQIVCVKG